MKFKPWSIPWLTARALAGGVLGCAAIAQAQLPTPGIATFASTDSPTRISLAQALDAAWTRSLEATESSGLRQRALAEQQVAGNWLAAAPSVLLAQREGVGTSASASRETEAGLVFPLWRPDQRRSSSLAAQAEGSLAESFQAAARWRLAAQLRELAGKLQVTDAELRQAGLQRELLSRLAADVQRRVAAGDLAPSDALAAQAELLAAQAREAEMCRLQQEARANWQLRTGVSAEPEPEAPRGVAKDLSEHPQAMAADAAVTRARQRVALIQTQRGAQPELGVSVRQERPGQGQPRQNSVAVSIRLPFGTDSYIQPHIAAALAEQDLALTQQTRVRQQLASELGLAFASLASSQQQALAETARAALLRQRAGLLHRSFEAGETALPELLRALTAAAQADAAEARQQAAVAQAQARVHQAQGILP